MSDSRLVKTGLRGLTRFHQADLELSEQWLSSTPLYSGYWVKKRIESAIKKAGPHASGSLLDVGCGNKPYAAIFQPYVRRHIGIEYSRESGYRGNTADIYADACSIPLADNSIDTILCTEVMEHLPDPEGAVAEFARVLRPGGVLITTAPFFYPIHDPFDFFRYSPDGLPAMLRRHGLSVEHVEPLSGTAVTLAILINIYWFEIGFMWTKWLYPIGVILRPVLWLICLIVNCLGWVFEKILPSNHMSFNHLTIARK